MYEELLINYFSAEYRKSVRQHKFELETYSNKLNDSETPGLSHDERITFKLITKHFELGFKNSHKSLLLRAKRNFRDANILLKRLNISGILLDYISVIGMPMEAYFKYKSSRYLEAENEINRSLIHFDNLITDLPYWQFGKIQALNNILRIKLRQDKLEEALKYYKFISDYILESKTPPIEGTWLDKIYDRDKFISLLKFNQVFSDLLAYFFKNKEQEKLFYILVLEKEPIFESLKGFEVYLLWLSAKRNYYSDNRELFVIDLIRLLNEEAPYFIVLKCNRHYLI